MRKIADLVLDEYINNGADAFVSIVDKFPPSLLQPTSRVSSSVLGGGAQQSFGKDRSLYSEQLAFLGKYRDFHKLYAEERLHEATAVLVSTLLEGQAPERFWAVLLLDATPLLESSLMLFEEDGIMELIRYFEQVSTCARVHQTEAEHYLGMMERLVRHSRETANGAGDQQQQAGSKAQKSTSSSKVSVDLALKRLEPTRLALARCLTNAYLYENSTLAPAI